MNLDIIPTTLFFDLDDTLYPSASGLWEAIRQRMTTYMEERLGFSADEVDADPAPLFHNLWHDLARFVDPLS